LPQSRPYTFHRDVEIHRIQDAGNWTLHDQPEAVSRIMVDSLTRRFAD